MPLLVGSGQERCFPSVVGIVVETLMLPIGGSELLTVTPPVE
ncbi:hypothetical protein [Halolamina sp.]